MSNNLLVDGRPIKLTGRGMSDTAWKQRI